MFYLYVLIHILDLVMIIIINWFVLSSSLVWCVSTCLFHMLHVLLCIVYLLYCSCFIFVHFELISFDISLVFISCYKFNSIYIEKNMHACFILFYCYWFSLIATFLLILICFNVTPLPP